MAALILALGLEVRSVSRAGPDRQDFWFTAMTPIASGRSPHNQSESAIAADGTVSLAEEKAWRIKEPERARGCRRGFRPSSPYGLSASARRAQLVASMRSRRGSECEARWHEG